MNQCTDILKSKDDSPSFLPTKLAAISSIGMMYKSLGRLMGRSSEETIALLLRTLKSAESQTRSQIFLALEMIIAGLGSFASGSLREILKAVRHGLTDRVTSVKVAAADCLREMVHHAAFLSTSELETICSLCFRSLEGSNYEVRCAIALVLASLVESSQKPPSNSPTHSSKGVSIRPLEEVLSILASGFLKGGIGFLKTSSATDIIKGSVVSRETRLGVTHAYALLIHLMGSVWWENNASLLINHFLELPIHPKSSTSHVESVFSRRCVSYIITSSAEKLSEKSQGQVIKELVKIIVKHGCSLVSKDSKGNLVEENDSNLSSQHLLICALNVIGILTETLGTTCSPLLQDTSLSMIDAIISQLSHSSSAVRLSASWCLRCISISCPAHLTPLLDRCLEKLEDIKSSGTGITGFSAAIAALIGAAHQTPLGIPHQKGKIVFNLAEEMLRSSCQNSQLSLQRSASGWLLIGSTMTLGPSVVRSLLPRLLLLWKNSFPRSGKDLESEKARGDAFTWQVTLESRSGALSAMVSLLSHCPSIVTEDVTRRILPPIESAISMLQSLSQSLKSYGPAVKAAAATTRLRIFEVLLLLPSNLYESSMSSLLKLLVSEFTLSDSTANTTTSLMQMVCSPEDEVLLGSWIQSTDHRFIEDQLEPGRKSEKSFIQPNSSTSGALEHDVTAIYKVPEVEGFGPLPLGVTIIDNSCRLYGHVFKLVHNKHREQMFSHFSELVKNSKAVRQEAVTMNILTAIYFALKNLTESKSSLGSEEVRTNLLNFLLPLLPNLNPMIRVAAAQTLAKMGQVIEGKVVSEVASTLFEKLKSSRDVPSRTGYGLAIGCLHRQVGNLGSHSHLNTAIGMLLALTHDMTSPVVQAWSLHSMTLIAECGPSFRSYTDPAVTQSLRLLTSVPVSYCDVHQCIGKLLAAVIITVGPELQSETECIKSTRNYLMLGCSLMQVHSDPLVQTQAIQCLQQLHMFAPKHLNLSSLVPSLCQGLESQDMFLRQACISCLHQLAQIEATEVHKVALSWTSNHKIESFCRIRVILTGEHGLPGLLMSVYDTETDVKILSNIKKTIDGFVQSFAAEELYPWIVICKEVLTSADSNSALSSPDKDFDGDEDLGFNDDVTFRTKGVVNPNNFGPPKWKTRVLATELLRKLISTCASSNLSDCHFDLKRAREECAGNEDGRYLVFHVSDLIRMGFMAATSNSDPLRLEGLEALQVIIDKFAKIPEPDFPDHVVLEQFQAQVGAALRPAFSSDTPSHVTAKACQVCSTWIGSGVARDLNDLRRVHQLLVSSIAKLQRDTTCHQYNESASTMEKLAILKAWSEVYVVAMMQEKAMLEKKLAKANNCDEDDEDEDLGLQENLLQLVAPELNNLSLNWLSCLRDHALLTLPSEFSSQLPHDGGTFYSSDTIELARPIYRTAWPPILHAAALWLCSRDFVLQGDDGSKEEYFHLLFGICMESLCSPRPRDPINHVIVSLQSLKTLLSHPLSISIAGHKDELSLELCRVLHRLLLTRESLPLQKLVIEIVHCLVKAHMLKSVPNKPLFNGECSGDKSIVEKSISFVSLEVCLCVLVRQIPQLSPSLTTTQTSPSKGNGKSDSLKLSTEAADLVSLCLDVLTKLPEMCPKPMFIKMLTPVLFLTGGIVKETCCIGLVIEPLVEKVVSTFSRLCSCPLGRANEFKDEYDNVLRSTLSMILDLCKTGDEGSRIESIVALRIVTVFVSKSPSSVGRAPNLRFPVINLFTQSLQSFKGDDVSYFVFFVCVTCFSNSFSLYKLFLRTK